MPPSGYRNFTLGIQLAVGMGLFVGIGWWLDQKRGEGSIAGTVIGAFVGLAYIFYELWKLVNNNKK